MKSVSHSQNFTHEKSQSNSYKNDKKLHDQLIGLGMVIKSVHKVLGKKAQWHKLLVLHRMEHGQAVFLKGSKEILRQAF